MADFRQIALLIDADNTQPQKMDTIVEQLSLRGRIAVRRAFGNWRKKELAAYPDLYELMRTGQGLCYRSLTNDGATDSPLTTEAEHSQKQEPPQGEEMTQDDAQPPGTEDTQSPIPRRTRKPRKPKTAKPEPESLTLTPDLSAHEIHGQLRAAAEAYANDSGFVHLNRAGMFIRKSHPDFMVKLSGYRSLSQLIKSYPALYRLREKKVNGVAVFSYRCL